MLSLVPANSFGRSLPDEVGAVGIDALSGAWFGKVPHAGCRILCPQEFLRVLVAAKNKDRFIGRKAVGRARHGLQLASTSGS